MFSWSEPDDGVEIFSTCQGVCSETTVAVVGNPKIVELRLVIEGCGERGMDAERTIDVYVFIFIFDAFNGDFVEFLEDRLCVVLDTGCEEVYNA